MYFGSHELLNLTRACGIKREFRINYYSKWGVLTYILSVYVKSNENPRHKSLTNDINLQVQTINSQLKTHNTIGVGMI